MARAWRTFGKRYDIVHCHFGNHGQRLAALKASGQLPGKLIVSFHGADLSRDRQRDMHDYYRLLFAVGDLFLPISRHWANRLEFLGCPPDRILVQHMGVDTEELSRRRRPLRANAHVRVGSIGRFVEKKGHAFTIQALARLKNDRPDLTIYLDLVGDGPLLGQSKDLAVHLGVAGLVTFHGALPHQAALSVMSECDLFALPSITAADGDQEGIPVVLMEAMAMRLPVVSTFHSGIPELVDHDTTGLLTAERDVEGLARHIETLATRPDLRDTFGDAGFAKVNAEFNSRKLGAVLRARYQSLAYPDGS
jgi:colanic acid/amylovoran biosynthesis glycosyltransferase